VEWVDRALAEIDGLKRHWVKKYGWAPRRTVQRDDAAKPTAVDLYVDLRGRRLGDKTYVLRLRYLPDWQVAGRREAFVDPSGPAEPDVASWPPSGSVRGINPNNAPPVICLRGVWGYHSVLHSNERPDGSTLLGFLLELQKVIDE